MMGLNPIEHAHAAHVAGRRVEVLVNRLGPLLPKQGRILDVGAGDGTIAACLMARRPGVAIEGVDVLVRPGAAIPVAAYDGARLPYPEASFDAVMAVDALHHTADPMALLREAVRVSRRWIVLKDHACDGWLARPVLSFMDRVGNARHGVASPGTYWPKRRWLDAFGELGLRVDAWVDRLGLYPWPASLVFERSLHFIARLERAC
jgi:SAM-dependent methyltransferase